MKTRESAREREFLPISHPKNPLRRAISNNSYPVFPEPQVNFDDGHEHSCACGSFDYIKEAVRGAFVARSAARVDVFASFFCLGRCLSTPQRPQRKTCLPACTRPPQAPWRVVAALGVGGAGRRTTRVASYRRRTPKSGEIVRGRERERDTTHPPPTSPNISRRLLVSLINLGAFMF